MNLSGIDGRLRAVVVGMAMPWLAACASPDAGSTGAAGATTPPQPVAASTASVPPDFPFQLCPLPTAMSVDTKPDSSTGEPQTMVAFTCPDTVDLVSRFYQYQLLKAGWEVQGEIITTSNGSQVISATKEQTHAMIDISPEREDRPGTRVSIVTGPKHS